MSVGHVVAKKKIPNYERNISVIQWQIMLSIVSFVTYIASCFKRSVKALL